jgi:hypothetical protein
MTVSHIPPSSSSPAPLVEPQKSSEQRHSVGVPHGQGLRILYVPDTMGGGVIAEATSKDPRPAAGRNRLSRTLQGVGKHLNHEIIDPRR